MSTKILIIDSDENLRIMLEASLSLAGYEVITAGDGKEGLHVIKDAQPVLVILDTVLPGMSGFQIVQQVRSLPDPLDKTVFIVTSEKKEMGDLFSSASVQCFMAKPLIPSEVTEQVRKGVEKGLTARGEEVPREAIDRSIGKILVVGGAEDLKERIKSHFNRLGYVVLMTDEENEVMRMAVKNMPKVILTQYTEEPDGFNIADFNRNMKNDSYIGHIPFRVLCHSDLLQQADKEFSREMIVMYTGFQDMLKKVEKIVQS